MIINPSTLQAIYQSFEVIFDEAFQSVSPIYPKIAMELTSDTKETVFPIMNAIPGMKEIVGPMVFNNLSGKSVSIKNRDFAEGIEVGRSDIQDDRIGFYQPAIKQLGVNAAAHPDELLFGLVEEGESELCFDGQPFFSDAHPVNMDDASLGTFGNLWSKDTASGAKPLTAENFAAARAALRRMKKANGQPMVRGPLTLLVPPSMETTAAQILHSEILAPGQSFGAISNAGGSTNVLQGTADLVVSEYLESDTAWYLLAQSGPVRPFVFVKREAAQFSEQTDPSSDAVFRSNVYRYKAFCRSGAGFALPHLAIKCDGRA